MREKDVLASEDGENEKEASKEHKEDQGGEDEAEERRQEGVNVFQPYHRNIPEQKDQDEQNDTGKD